MVASPPSLLSREESSSSSRFEKKPSSFSPSHLSICTHYCFRFPLSCFFIGLRGVAGHRRALLFSSKWAQIFKSFFFLFLLLLLLLKKG